MIKEERFHDLCGEVSTCIACERMCDSSKVLGPSSGKVTSDLMFIGEAPGRLGADNTTIPFHGDKSGHNFEELLEFASLSRSQIFVTNAVLCNPRNSQGNNATPNKQEIENCSEYLKRQIDLINPKIVVTLGATALKALSLIEPHKLTLKKSVRTQKNWYGRILIPIYHPGQRAMLHRSFANQRSDYKFVFDAMRSLGMKRVKVYGEVSFKIADLLEYIFWKHQNISYFGLHKLVYLVEYEIYKKYGVLYTGAYFIRQKDGPYCTNLHIQKIKNTFKNLKTSTNKGKLYVENRDANNLFSETPKLAKSPEKIDREASLIIDKLLESSDKDLKKKAYLSKPMRTILRKEQRENINSYNAPILFDIQEADSQLNNGIS
ncbi:uracil-DNA glycosylase family protein [Sphaerothrix gracilis]|uniref:uracil-DNA glycosylase family protein n=1 Tax=Sphaerothrix gracilis TaxID=3151835 RepID=UPI0031FCF4E7